MIFAAWCACCAMSVAAQDCEISLTIAKAAQKEELPSQVQEILGNRLAAAVAGQGSVANSNFTPFFITARTNTLYKETLSGPPVSTALTVQLTLYIGDAVGQKVFSTLTVDAKGVPWAIRDMLPTTAAISKLDVGSVQATFFIFQTEQ